MTDRAKIFKKGGSPAVRFRRVDNGVILAPPDEWTPEFIDALGSWRNPIERPDAKPVGKRKAPFE